LAKPQFNNTDNHIQPGDSYMLMPPKNTKYRQHLMHLFA
jgi:hypothetical protein